MAKSLETILQEQLGALLFQLASLTQQLEVAREEIATLKGEKPHNGDASRKAVEGRP